MPIFFQWLQIAEVLIIALPFVSVNPAAALASTQCTVVEGYQSVNQTTSICDGQSTEAVSVSEPALTKKGIPQLPQTRPLRWRTKAYNHTGNFSIYGGRFVASSFSKAGFVGPVEDDTWDVLFTHWSMVKALSAPGPWTPRPRRPVKRRLTNHCGYFKAAGCKCRLARHVKHIKAAYSPNAELPGFLRTFLLDDPKERAAWHSAALAEPQRHWIMKPCDAGRSKGIRLLKGSDKLLGELTANRSWAVAQEFVQHPYMGWGGRKFHMRLFVLVTRWLPEPRVLLYDEGLVFRSRDSYNAKTPNVTRDVFSGISSSVQPFPLSALWAAVDEAEGTPEGESSYYVQEHIEGMLSTLFDASMVNDTFGDATFLDESTRGYSCFDLFGVDVMLDDELRPYLLEVNVGPNLWVDGSKEQAKVLQQVKEPLLKQLLEWMELRLRHPPKAQDEGAELEAYALENFTTIETD